MKGTPQQTFEQFSKVGEAGVTIMVQDAPLSGVDLHVPLLIKMAKEIEMVKCFKIECAQAWAHSILKHLTISISFAIFIKRGTCKSTPDNGAS